MKAERLLISGRVQGVGYRDWLVAEAARLGVTGWVRNLGADQVEAVVCGPHESIDHIVSLCRRGPRWANVTDVQRNVHAVVSEPEFRRLPSV
jgi:acylphosphatase